LAKDLIKSENKLQFVAEKLDAPITLNDLNIRGNSDVNSGYEDAFLGIEKIKPENES